MTFDNQALAFLRQKQIHSFHSSLENLMNNLNLPFYKLIQTKKKASWKIINFLPSNFHISKVFKNRFLHRFISCCRHLCKSHEKYTVNSILFWGNGLEFKSVLNAIELNQKWQISCTLQPTKEGINFDSKM